MPPRRAPAQDPRRTTAQDLEEIQASLERLQVTVETRDQGMIDLIEEREQGLRDYIHRGLDQVNNSVHEMFTFIRERVGAGQGQQGPPHRHVEPADRIPKPKPFDKGKLGFIRFLHNHLLEHQNDHGALWVTVSNAAYISVQNLRREHEELLLVPWGELNHNYQMQMCRETYNIAVAEDARLEIMGRCVDLWPCIAAVQPKWSQQTSIRKNKRYAIVFY